MSTDRPDSTEDLDDIPTLRPIPSGDNGDDRERDDYRDDRPRTPPRKPGFGFWMAVAWSLLYFVVTQFIGALALGIPIIGIALIVDTQINGNGIPNDPAGLNEWMLGPTG